MKKQRDIQGEFAHLLKVVSGDRFLKMQSLNGEIPFYIYAYPPEKYLDVVNHEQHLVRDLTNRSVKVLQVNLYDLVLKLLQEREILEQVFEVETEHSKDELKDLLQNVLDPEEHLIPAIADILAVNEYDVLFLSGVGEVFPYLRSHSILNNLQSTATDRPTLLFFPGDYSHSLESGASLDLFGILHDDKYYRAFNIMHCD